PPTKTAPTQPSTLSLHDALPICSPRKPGNPVARPEGAKSGPVRADHTQRPESAGVEGDAPAVGRPHRGALGRPTVREVSEVAARSEEHTSELQSRSDLVCRLLLE